MRRSVIAALLVAAGVSGGVSSLAAPSAPVRASTASKRILIREQDTSAIVLRVADLPKGWRVEPDGAMTVRSLCGLASPDPVAETVVFFTNAEGDQLVGSGAYNFASVADTRLHVGAERQILRCNPARLSSAEVRVTRIAALALPRLGEESVALAIDYRYADGYRAQAVRVSWRRGETVLFYGLIAARPALTEVRRFTQLMNSRYVSA